MNRPHPNASRVAVTGMGLIAPGAIGTAAFLEALAEGRHAVTAIERFDTSDLQSHCAAVVSGFAPKQWIPAMKLRRMSGLSRLAVAGAKMALEDASCESIGPPDRVGVSLGMPFGPVETSANYLEEYIAKGPALAPPQLFAESVANAPGSHVAIELDLRGFNITFTQREGSALTAALYAANQIVRGTADAALTGGAEDLNEITYGVLDRIRALARASKDVPEGSRPFGSDRNGMIVGEGAVVLVLESAARAAGRRVWGWLSGFGIARDASATISDWGSGTDAVTRAMGDAIRDAGIARADIDAVFASANGSIRGDRLEALALRSFFEDGVPPVVAVKSAFGEYAAGGSLPLAAALAAVREQRLFATVNAGAMDPDMELPLTKGREPRLLRNVLVNSLSAGGGIVSAVVSRDAE